MASGSPHEREHWLSQRPATEDQGLIREFGQDGPSTAGSPQTSDQYTFERIGDVIAEGLVPPALAGAGSGSPAPLRTRWYLPGHVLVDPTRHLRARRRRPPR